MKKFGLLLIALFLSASVKAETVTLTSGSTIEGRMIEETEEYIKIDFQGTPLTYYRDEIQDIDRNPRPQSVRETAKTLPVEPASAGDPFKEFISVCQEVLLNTGLFEQGDLVNKTCECIAMGSKKDGLPPSEMAEIVTKTKADFKYKPDNEIFNKNVDECHTNMIQSLNE